MPAAEDEIRALVRELLRDIVPVAATAPPDDVRVVRVESDADLQAFAALVVDIARDPAAASGIRSGRIRFALEHRDRGRAPADAGRASAAPAASAPVLRIDRGAVTERIVAGAAADGSRLVLGARAVLTPLARESARKHGVGIERAS